MKLAVLLVCLLISFVKADYLDEFRGETDDDELGNIDKHTRQKVLFQFEEDWPSENVWSKLGPISAAVPMDPSGTRTLVLHRADRSWDEKTFDASNKLRNTTIGPIKDGVLAILDSGKLVGKFLKNRFYVPHGLSIDPYGNIWITDVGLHQIFKFGPDLKETPLLILGEALHPGADGKHFCKPTHVVAARNGEFFVSDGYCNSRILKFNSKGELLSQWGEKSNGRINSGPYHLDIPHQMILVEEEDVLCVADREDYRVLCYTAGLTPASRNQTGQFIGEIRTAAGPVYGIAYCPHTRTIFLLVGNELDGFEVQAYDFDTQEYVGRIIDVEQDYGDAHTISTCGSLRGSACLLVSSLSEPAEDDMGQPKRRLWFYRLLPASRD